MIGQGRSRSNRVRFPAPPRALFLICTFIFVTTAIYMWYVLHAALVSTKHATTHGIHRVEAELFGTRSQTGKLVDAGPDFGDLVLAERDSSVDEHDEEDADIHLAEEMVEHHWGDVEMSTHDDVDAPVTPVEKPLSVDLGSLKDSIQKSKAAVGDDDVIKVPVANKVVNMKRTDIAHGVRDLPASEFAGMDWLEKGRHVVDINRHLLDEHRYDSLPEDITLVSTLFDLGRGKLDQSFKRPFSYYIERFRQFLEYKFPKIIFIEEEHYDEFKPYLDLGGPTTVLFRSKDEMRSQWYYPMVQKIRTDPAWFNEEAWLRESPQAKLELYNPLVMSKIYWLRDASRLNPYNTRYFLWIDGAHLCNSPDQMTPDKMGVFKNHFDRFLITYFDYVAYKEVHGFKHHKFDEYIGKDFTPVRVGRGGIFGSTPGYAEVAAQVYDIILNETLSSGFMGTEENIFSLLYYRFPELIHKYDNAEGGNCAIINEAVHGPPKPPGPRGVDLRGIECYTIPGRKREACFHVHADHAVQCPDYVDHKFLSKGVDKATGGKQGFCQPEAPDWFCTLDCREGDSKTYWVAHNVDWCEEETKKTGSRPCPKVPPVTPWPEWKTPELKPDNPLMKFDNVAALLKGVDRKETIKELKKDIVVEKAPATAEDSQNPPYNLRGLKCYVDAGKKPVCFQPMPKSDHTVRCPDYVTPEWLTAAYDRDGNRQGLCLTKDHFCMVTCSDTTDETRWIAYNKQWCRDQRRRDPDACPEAPDDIPYSQWTPTPMPTPSASPTPMVCNDIATPHKEKKLTILVLLYNEMDSFKASLKTWIDGNLLQYADEVLIWINSRTPEKDAIIEPYQKEPWNIKVLGDSRNHGLTRALIWLVGNATSENVLFLEKDFQLIESEKCFRSQLDMGKDLLGSGDAHVVKYRSRYKPGYPNWAEILYRGKEDEVFARQPNLFCNHYHWIIDIENKYPEDKIRVCRDSPKFYCSKAYYCNWTNNPVMFPRSWWVTNYSNPKGKSSDPYDNLETWMNWEKGAWNDRPWIVAQGDGLFAHVEIGEH